MPEISKNPVVPLEGVVLPPAPALSEVVEQIIQINNSQLLETVNKLNELTRAYTEFALKNGFQELA